MSKPSALPSPQARASRPAPTAPPAGPERTLQAPARAASARRRDAAGGLHHQRLRAARPPPPPRSSRAEVAAEQGREVGVDHGRRAALVLAEAGQHLVRGGDVDVGQPLPQVLGEAPLVGRVEVGEEQADRHRLGAARRGRRGEPLRLAVGERLETPSGPIRSAASKRSSRLDQRRRLRRAEPVELRAGPGGRSRAGRRSRGWRSAPCGRRVPRAARWCRRSSRGRRPRPSPGRRRPAPSTASIARDHPADWSSGRGRQLGRVDAARRRRGRRR